MLERSLIRIVALGSGSAGNAIAVSDGTTTLLVDAGLSAREIARRLAEAGIEAANVAALLLTHEHSDHVRGVDVFLRRHAPECVVFGSTGTLACAAGIGEGHERSQAVAPGECFSVGTLSVLPFSTSHDAAQPVGYRFATDGDCAGVVTDTGVMTPQAMEALAGCRLIGLECNHDLEMLERGPYPVYLKRRIGSHAGHLSNDAAADALDSLAHNGLAHVMALHRSETNNTARLASRALENRLARIGLNVAVSVASQGSICDSDPPQQSLFPR